MLSGQSSKLAAISELASLQDWPSTGKFLCEHWTLGRIQKFWGEHKSIEELSLFEICIRYLWMLLWVKYAFDVFGYILRNNL